MNDGTTTVSPGPMSTSIRGHLEGVGARCGEQHRRLRDAPPAPTLLGALGVWRRRSRSARTHASCHVLEFAAGEARAVEGNRVHHAGVARGSRRLRTRQHAGAASTDLRPLRGRPGVSVPWHTRRAVRRGRFDHVAPARRLIEIIIVDDGSGDGTWDDDSSPGLGARRGSGGPTAAELWTAQCAPRRSAAARLAARAHHRRRPAASPQRSRDLLDAVTDDVDLVYGRPAHERQGAIAISLRGCRNG